MLQKMVGFFIEVSDIAFGRSPHIFRSPDLLERNLKTLNWAPAESELFHGNMMKCQGHWNAAFFCGSAPVFSTAARVTTCSTAAPEERLGDGRTRRRQGPQ